MTPTVEEHCHLFLPKKKSAERGPKSVECWGDDRKRETHAGPIIKVDDILVATTLIEAKNDKKKKSFHSDSLGKKIPEIIYMNPTN